MNSNCCIPKYTYWRIKKIFREDYALDLQKIIGYKAARYSAQRYNLVHPDGTVELANVTLDGLRAGLFVEGYPLKEES